MPLNKYMEENKMKFLDKMILCIFSVLILLMAVISSACIFGWVIEWFNRNKVLGYEKDTRLLQQIG